MPFDALSSSLQFFASGIDGDTCFLSVTRDNDHTNTFSGTVTINGDRSYTATYDSPSAFCDSFACVSSHASVQVFPQPFDPRKSVAYPLNILASTQAKPPVDLSLDIWTEDLFRVRHSVQKGLPQLNQWYAIWDGLDDLGRIVASGRYVYRVDADGVVRNGKIIIVTK